jgi:hypothetical protein
MKWILLALQLLPGILSTVKAVETSIGAGNGKAKKQIVMDAILAGATAAQTIPEEHAQAVSTLEHAQAVSTLVDTTVKVLNNSGIFQTTAKV